MLDTKKVGIKIASLRKSFGYSQERLAEMLNISPQAISKWENDRALPETSILPALAQIFGCTIDDIIMSAYLLDEKIENKKTTVIEEQAEHIAKYVVNKMENQLKQNENIGLNDDEIADAVIKAHNIDDFTIEREKTSRADGRISTKIKINSLGKDLNLIELIYHKRPDEFNSYAFLNGYINEIPQIYNIDYNKKLLLMDDLSDSYIKGYDFDEDNENGYIIRANYNIILRAVANFHSAFWENKEAFDKFGSLWHHEAKENTLAWIYNAMEKPFRKYRKNEEKGKIPKAWEIFENHITKEQLDYFEQALEYLKVEYVKLIDTRFCPAKNTTIVHGDLHPGQTLMSNSLDRDVKFTGLQAVRRGLCTEDLAMLIALHIEPDKKKAQPLLDYYYECLSEKVKDYSYEMFLSDYKLSVAENMFFTIRLIDRGIYDYSMRDRAIKAFETFVLE